MPPSYPGKGLAPVDIDHAIVLYSLVVGTHAEGGPLWRLESCYWLSVYSSGVRHSSIHRRTADSDFLTGNHSLSGWKLTNEASNCWCECLRRIELLLERVEPEPLRCSVSGTDIDIAPRGLRIAKLRVRNEQQDWERF